MFKLIGLVTIGVILLQIDVSKAQGNNLYLPPDKGYDYPAPPNQNPPRPVTSPGQPPSDGAHEPGMPFDFNYAVNDIETEVNHNHKALSDGDITRGEYRVQLPDGRTQVVTYTADWKNGYNAEVTYE